MRCPASGQGGGMTSDPSHSRPADLRFWFDPVCPFAWMTSTWVRMVAAQRDYRVEWRLISLRLLNAHVDYDAHFPPEYEEGHTAGLRLLRVVARARAEHGPEVVGPLYAALGQRFWEQPPGPPVPSRLRAGDLLPPALGVGAGEVGEQEDWHAGSRRHKK